MSVDVPWPYLYLSWLPQNCAVWAHVATEAMFSASMTYRANRIRLVM